MLIRDISIILISVYSVTSHAHITSLVCLQESQILTNFQNVLPMYSLIEEQSVPGTRMEDQLEETTTPEGGSSRRALVPGRWPDTGKQQQQPGWKLEVK